MIIHTKEKAEIHIVKSKKSDIKDGETLKKSKGHIDEWKSGKKNVQQSIKTKGSSIKVVGAAGANNALNQMEGGDEVKDAAMVAYGATRPVAKTISKGANLINNRLMQKQVARIKKVDAGKNLARKKAKQSASNIAKNSSKQAAKTAAKETAKAASKETAKTCTTVIKRACKKVGIREYNCHDFRHTYISNLIKQATPIPVIESVSGDTQETIFKRYSHMFEGDEYMVLKALEAIEFHK